MVRMPEGKTPIKISPKIFIWVGMITIVIFFTSIIITAIDMVEYRHSRVITYSTMLIAVSLYVIYALLNRKQLIIDLPQKEQTKYLLVVIALITALQALVFLCIVL